MNESKSPQSRGSPSSSGDTWKPWNGGVEQVEKEYLAFKVGLEDEWAKHPTLAKDNNSRMLHLLTSEALSDVTFLVGDGDNKSKVRGHRFILRDTSEFFKVLLSDRWNAQNQAGIEIPGVEPVDFRSFLEFLYTGVLRFKTENALPLLYLSRVYQIPKLGAGAVLFMMSNMNPDNAFPVLKSMSPFDDADAKKLTKTAQDFIEKNATIMFKRSEFSELRYEDLKQIMMSTKLRHPNELEIVLSCLRWAVAECKRQNLEQTPQNFRKVLGDVFKEVRFPLIGKFSFSFETNYEEILNRDETMALRSYWAAPMTIPKMLAMSNTAEYRRMEVERYFKVKPRNTTIFSVNRFLEFKSSQRSWTYPKRRKADRISFQVSTSATINGIGLYGRASSDSNSSKFDYDVDVDMYAHDKIGLEYGRVSYKQRESETDSANGRIFKVMFDKPVEVTSNVWYTIAITIQNGDRSYFGTEGKETVLLECQRYPVMFKFKDAVDRKPTEFLAQRLSSNGTGVTKGQIPIIYFSIDEDDDEVIVI